MVNEAASLAYEAVMPVRIIAPAEFTAEIADKRRDHESLCED
jgi:hypothetical protein